MNKTTIKILLSILALIVAGATIHWMRSYQGAQNGGTITIIVVDADATTIIEDEITFTAYNEQNKKTTMRMVLQAHYDIEIKNGMLVRIESVAADTKDYFIKIWINCEPSLYGIDQMPFKDGDVIRFIYTKVGDMSDAC